jgi:hypothetical protein
MRGSVYRHVLGTFLSVDFGGFIDATRLISGNLDFTASDSPLDLASFKPALKLLIALFIASS